MPQNKFAPARAIELRYTLALRKVARTIAGIIGAHIDGPVVRDQVKMQRQLEAYAESLGPWAEKLAAGFIKSVNRTSGLAWAAQSQSIAKRLKTEIATTSIGRVVKKLQREQVTLIKSLPIEAGLRAQRLALEAATGGKRAGEVAAELLRTEQVTSSRATLIARTEIAKANAAVNRARAEFVGATHYIWQTAEDGDVRESHAALNGQKFRYDDPPSIEGEGQHGPGEVWNCRCYSAPVLA